MTGPEVLEVLRALRAAGVDAWVTGGWGDDALVGRQTRPHEALELVVRLEDVERIRTALALLGFSVREEALPARFGFSDPTGREVRLQTLRFDAEGAGVQERPDGGELRHPPERFTRGRIEGREVDCLRAAIAGGAGPPEVAGRRRP